MQIVLDTNIIFDHWQLDGPNFPVLEKLIRCELFLELCQQEGGSKDKASKRRTL